MTLSRHVFLAVAMSSLRLAAADEDPPRDWIDPASGHRIVRLSREPGSASLYFHQNTYTAEGDKMIIATPSGLAAVNLKTRELDVVVSGAEYSGGGSSGVELGRKSRQVYYSRRQDTQSVIYATHISVGQLRRQPIQMHQHPGPAR